jgi:geranylgeranyl pyrophosphate synthase
MGEAARRAVNHLMLTPEPTDEQIDTVIAAVEAAGGLDYARARAARLAEQAEAELECLPASTAREVLRASISYVLDRRR